MNYIGDFPVGQDIVIFFTTNDKDGGFFDPNITSGCIRIYKDGSWSDEIVVDDDELTENVDSLTGVHRIILDVSDHSDFYTSGSDFSLIMTAIVDTEAVRAELGSFSIENRFAGSLLFEKAAKMLVNKAVQDKTSGVINYYDDDGETIILTHTPSDAESTLTRTPN